MDLSPAESGELEAAAEPLVAAESNIGAMKQSDFPLPSLGSKLAALRQELIHGRGFALLRGCRRLIIVNKKRLRFFMVWVLIWAMPVPKTPRDTF
jgi:hypothetical protein